MDDSPSVCVAALQPQLVFGDPTRSLDLVSRLAGELVRDAPVDVLVLPEIFDGDPEPSDGTRARSFLAGLAKGHGAHVIGGSCLVRDEQGRQFNRCWVFDRSGREVAVYDKRVLFSGEASLREPGRLEGLVTLDALRFGVLICADLWHPELARDLFDRVDVLAVAAKTSVPSEAHQDYARASWQAMALTRALENGVAVIVADWPDARHDRAMQVDDARTRQTHYTCGATCIVDPSHRPNLQRLHRTMPPGQAGALRAEIRRAELHAFRSYRQSVGLLPPDRPRK